MKLYYSPGACSLSPHIALLEAGLPYDLVKVDLKAKQLENGDDYLKVNPKGQVPALGLDSGELVTEGPVIVQMIADKAAAKNLAPARDYLMGKQFTVADGYLFTMLCWADRMKFDLSALPNLLAYKARVGARPMVQEGLMKAA